MAFELTDNSPILVDGEEFLSRLADEMERCERYEHSFTVLTMQPPRADGQPELPSSEWLDWLTHGLVRGCDLIAVFEREPMVAVLLPETGVAGAGALLERIRSVIPDSDQEWAYTLLEYPTNQKKIRGFMDQAA